MLFGFIDPKSYKKGERQSYRKWKSQLDTILISLSSSSQEKEIHILPFWTTQKKKNFGRKGIFTELYHKKTFSWKVSTLGVWIEGPPWKLTDNASVMSDRWYKQAFYVSVFH